MVVAIRDRPALMAVAEAKVNTRKNIAISNANDVNMIHS